MSIVSEKRNIGQDLINYARNNRLEETLLHMAEQQEVMNEIQFQNGYALTTKHLLDSRYFRDFHSWELLPYNDYNFLPLSINKSFKVLKLNNYKSPGDQRFLNEFQKSSLNAWILVRMGLSLKILDQVVSYLEHRYIGEIEQIKMQLIKGDIAQFITEYHSLSIDLNYMELTSSNLEILHMRITNSNESLIKLCGGSGYIKEGVMEIYYVSRIIQQVYGVINV